MSKSKGHHKSTTKSPKARANMKREVEANKITAKPSTTEFKSVEELFHKKGK